jgi:hypothetical protein
LAKRKKNIVKLIRCACGHCDELISSFDKKGRPRKYANRHYWRGKKFSEEYKQKLSEARKGIKIPNTSGDKHWNWKADEIKYGTIHQRVKKKFPKSEHPICMLCKNSPSMDLACITGIYNDGLRNWAWFCHSCHMIWDNIGIRRRLKRKTDKKDSN